MKWHLDLFTHLIGTILAHIQFPFPSNIFPQSADDCLTLAALLPELVSFPGSPSYVHQSAQYWSLTQADQKPACRVTPNSAIDTSKIISTIRHDGSRKTVLSLKSGGHSANIGASNSDGGIAIDLAKLVSIEVARDRRSVNVGAGVRWKDVYDVLDALGLATTGAKAGSVGLGGYLLGGGLSVFSGLRGWACDTVESFEVVLANGTIISASVAQHSDLFIALKGGGSNFGIVTKFRLKLFPGRPLGTALISYSSPQIPAVIAAQDAFAQQTHLEPGSSVTISLAFDEKGNDVLSTASLVSVGAELRSSHLRPFFDIQHVYAKNETLTPGGLGLLLDVNNPAGFRQQRMTLTTISSPSLTSSATALFSASFAHHPFFTSDAMFRPALLLQPLTLPHLHHGENSLGLENETVPLLLLSLEIRSSDPNNDAHVTHLLRNFITACETEASKNGLFHCFKYLNYASTDQEAEFFSGGQRESLKEVQRRYDPEGFWKRQLSGPFKL